MRRDRCLLSRSLSGAKRTCPFALHMSAYDPKRTCPDLIVLVAALSYHRSLRESGHYARPQIVEKHECDRHDPAVYAARDKPIDEASNGQQCKVWEDRGQQEVPFKAGVDEP
jgi:hypothetical protein